MSLLLISFLAGALTVLAPCILPLLPVVIGSSMMGRSRYTPYIVIASLAASIILFTFLLKVSTAFIVIPNYVWAYISGGVVIAFGATLLVPKLWESMPGIGKLSRSSNKVVGSGYKKRSIKGDIIIGAALGPVFSTCSPTYFLILATVLPASYLLGTVYLMAYVLGLSLVLLLIAFYGDKIIKKLLPLADSRGMTKRVIGVLLIVVGLGIATGFDKKFETWMIDQGFTFINFEYQLLEGVPEQSVEVLPVEPAVSPATEAAVSQNSARTTNQPKFVELVSPDAYLNTGGQPITIGEQLPEKLVLVSFMTYSCINCQRTFPYLQQWHESYADDGLVVIGIHTPEFAFEHNVSAVQAALDEYGITFPVVLDNEYKTWRAYENRFWPRRYLIDRDGTVLFDHIGEGAYTETEALIQRYLQTT